MTTAKVNVKIGTDAELGALRSLKAELEKQAVALRTMGKAGEELKSVERNLAAVNAQIRGMGRLDKFTGAAGDFFKQLPVVGGAMKVLNGSAAGVGAAVTGIGIAFQQTLSAMRDATVLVDTANQLGMTSTAVQALNAHFGDAGIRAEQWQAASLKLGQTMAQAAAGSRPLQEAFAALGLNFFQLRALRPEEALAAVGKALADNAGNAEATAAAFQIMGEVAGRMRSSLQDLGQQGAGNLERAMVAAGRATENHLNRRLNEAQLKWDALMQRVRNTRNAIAADLVTAVEGGAERDPRLFTVFDRAQDSARLAALVRSANAENLDEVEELLARMPTQARGTAKDQAGAKARLAAAREALRQRAEEIQTEAAEAAARQAEAVALAAVQAQRAQLEAQAATAAEARLETAKQLALVEERLAKAREAYAAADQSTAAGAQAALAARKDELDLDAQALRLREQLTREDEAARRATEQAAQREREAGLLRAEATVAQLERERDLAAVRSDGTAATRTEELARLTERLRTAQAEVVRLRAAELSLLSDPIALARAEADLQAAQAKLSGIGAGTAPAPRRIAQARASFEEATGPSALSGPAEGTEAALLGKLTQIGTAGDQAARAVGSAFDSAFSGIENSLNGLIEGTMSWSDALSQIGSSIISGITQAITRMFTEWAAKRLLTFALGEKLKAAETASTISQEASKTPLLATNAAFASVGSFGAAALIGIAALAAVAAFAGGFRSGGYTGDGPPDQIAGVVHRGEYVIPADAVRANGGREYFDAIASGGILPAEPPARRAASPAASDAPAAPVNVAVVGSENQMRRFLESTAGRKALADAGRGRPY